MGLIVDLFAGGGGASEGIRMALGRDPDVAINHDAEAIAMHMANHPGSKHFISDVWEVDPLMACGRRPVDFLWASPDCTDHSKAKGSKPKRDSKRRALAWVVVHWARKVRPACIMLENVEEWLDWSPLDNEGKRVEAKKGLTFRIWLGKLQALGYKVETRLLRACDYGAPTTRRRLFLIARCDGRPIVWPEPTHDSSSWRPAADVIDWTAPCPSIFERTKPLCDNTLRRIAYGVQKHVIEAESPFLVPDQHGQLLASTLIQTGQGERKGQAPRVPGLGKPLGTVVANRSGHAIVTAFLAKHYGGHEGPGIPVTVPFGTITTKDHHALVVALLERFGVTPDGARRRDLGKKIINGETYVVRDVGMRFILPREQFRAQGFRENYAIEVIHQGRVLSKTSQTRMVGNSVSPPVARELVRANVAEQFGRVAA
jgi:DNA (cytosine-5)-methyltransferase 1